ncbi:type III-A CRISPR-associated RAMP protein Csm5 [Candidatus Poribacteria bacterium]|nr:MAG: type III-A CRISPR-associated RAMP protein Csm5 [Candidatus Poribacteria bacterium]
MKQKYQLQTLTPVHIGSGETLSHIDGCYANGRWYRIDLDKVLAHPSTDLNALTSEMARRDFRWERYLRQHGSNLSEFSAYSLLCPQNPEEVEIREAIKTVQNHPYIPGSTLKGAIRTALLGEILNENSNIYSESLSQLENLIDQGPRGNPRREQPARRIEGLAFGRDPNRDIFRALQVSDTMPLDSSSLEIGMAWTVTLDQNDQLTQKIDRGQAYKNFVQQIQARQCLTFTLKIDELLFREREKTRLGFSELQEKTLYDIAEVCRSATDELIQSEQDFFDYYHLSEIANVYDKLIGLNNALPEGAFLLQIGWGTGYHSNTVTSLFTNDEKSPENLQMDLRERFKLGESRSRRGNYDEREFPKTRRILYRGQNPIAPLGWVKISRLED